MHILIFLTVTNLLLSSYFVNGDVACNFVKLNVNLEINKYLQDTLGTFSLSTNRCQSLHALVDYYIDTANIDGSMEFTCGNNENQLLMKYYSDATCDKLAGTQTVYLNETFKLFEYVVFRIDELHCDKLTCEVGFTFAKNCTWIQSPLYLNVSIPPEQCLSFGADFKGVLAEVPQQVLPMSVVENLSERSYKYSCCSDNSLLMYNYTDTTCEKSSEYDAIRISSDKNGTCYKIYGDTSIFSEQQHNEQRESDAYRFVLQWTCATYANCDGIGFLSDDYFPSECDSHCMDGLHWVSGSGGGDKGTITLNKNLVIAVCISILVLFIICVIGVYFTTRHRRIKQEVEKQAEIIVSAEKYAPMIADDDDLVDPIENTQVEYVATDDNGPDDDENPNTAGGNGTQTTKRTFASMTASMTIDNVVIQDDMNDMHDDNDDERVVSGDALHDDIAAIEPLNAGSSNGSGAGGTTTTADGDVVDAPVAAPDTQRNDDEDGI